MPGTKLARAQLPTDCARMCPKVSLKLGTHAMQDSMRQYLAYLVDPIHNLA